MTITKPAGVAEELTQGIVAAVRDYYDGWFEGDVSRMQRALHHDLIKRGIANPSGTLETDSAETMLEGTRRGIGTRYGPDRRHIDICINHVHTPIADVHVTGDVYVDYLQLVRVDGRWQILNALWAPAESSKFVPSSS
jgi:hypothetical protein